MTYNGRTERILIRDISPSCSSRARGRAVYEVLQERVQQLGFARSIIISFDGVRFVSPSFLDETVVRLVEDHPEFSGRITLEGLSELAANGLNTVLRTRKLIGDILVA